MTTEAEVHEGLKLAAVGLGLATFVAGVLVLVSAIG